MIKTFYLFVHIYHLYPLAFTKNNEFELFEHEVSLMASRFNLLYMISYNKRSDWLIDYQCEANLHVVCTINIKTKRRKHVYQFSVVS